VMPRLAAHLPHAGVGLHPAAGRRVRKVRHQFEDLGVEGEFDDVLDSLGELSRKELLQVWDALQRIEQGRYGNCKECGNTIPTDRLKARTYAEAGIPTYWLVNPVDRCVEVYTQPGLDGYGSRHIAGAGEALGFTAGTHACAVVPVAAFLP
jgi:hypothetical protein